jgi:hypothetical protein
MVKKSNRVKGKKLIRRKKMNTKENKKKLKLDKETIVNLEKRVMSEVYGGDGGTIPPPDTETEKRPSVICNH